MNVLMKKTSIAVEVVNEHDGVCVSAVALGLTQRVQGSSAFLFGWADSPLQRGLAQRRRDMGWFKKVPDLQGIQPDVGPQPQRRYGLTGGSQPMWVTKVVLSCRLREFWVSVSEYRTVTLLLLLLLIFLLLLLHLKS